MSSVTQRIDGIIAARGTSLAKVRRTAENIAACCATVRRFELLKAKIKTSDNYKQLFRNKPEILERIAGVSTNEFFNVYQQ